MAPPSDLVQFCAVQYGVIGGALRGYGLDEQTAQDLAQETLIRVCSRWRQVRKLDSPAAWAHRVAINLANSHMRRVGAHTRALEKSRAGARVGITDVDVADSVTLRAALSRLPVRERQAVVLRFVCDFTVAETASVMDLSAGAVTSLTHRGMKRLRQILAVPAHGRTEADNV